MNTHKLKQMTALAAFVLLLAACASQPAYRAADGTGFGYSERQLTEDQFRIHFRGRGDNTGRAMDYAMLRATELTLEKGFDWFDVASRDTLVDRESVPASTTTSVGVSYATVQDCGLLTCSTYYRPVPQYQTSTTLGNQRSEVEVIMEIRMGKGMRPSGQTSYDARELYSRLKPEV
ncbi:MAG: hypothetical protein Q7W55_00840 [Pseudohongiella sp.]|nr:hypothetical protein [Pseudohongiella sp.]MDO9520552.1 hypothetical protein [Pseudohongiella sp.]MDP2126440.1 hypothetical protein [Pseudohongiella sp.]